MATILRNARYLDLHRRKTVPRTSVVIEGGMTTAMGANIDIPSTDKDTIVDCDGRYLLPGLMDMHVHLKTPPHRDGAVSYPAVPGRELNDAMKRVLHGFLYCGVTSVYDAGNEEDFIFRLRDAEQSGEVLAPRIFCAGAFVTTPGGHGTGLGAVTAISDLPADLAKLDAAFSRRPDLVKITYDEHNWAARPLVPILPPKLLRAIISRAHQARLRAVVHVSNETRAREALDCGADALAHPIIQSPATDELLWLLAVKAIPMLSTLTIGEQSFRLADHPEFVDEPLYVACVAEAERRYLATTEHELQLSALRAQWMRAMTPVAQANLKALIEQDGIVATGSDLASGPDLHREMALLQAGGVSPWEVLRCATINGARFLRTDRTMGSVAAGKAADLILVDDDPTGDVAALRSISFVMKGGEIIDRSAVPLAGTRSADAAVRAAS